MQIWIAICFPRNIWFVYGLIQLIDHSYHAYRILCERYVVISIVQRYQPVLIAVDVEDTNLIGGLNQEDVAFMAQVVRLQ